MKVRLAVLLGVALIVLSTLLTYAATHSAAPVPQLHSVWCVKQGYPPDLAMPYMVGPGTGLSGCPWGDRQVHEP